MNRPRTGILAELLPVFLILGCLGGTLALVLRVHQGVRTERRPSKSEPVAVAFPTIRPEPAPVPAEPAKPVAPPPVVVVPPPPPPPPAEDPTKKALAAIGSEVARQRAATAEADRRALALETARKAAEARSGRWGRRETLIRGQVASLTEKAETLERRARALAMERDALARERDASKAELARARAQGGGYAVLPHRGPNGTWQRPVVIECRDGLAILQPRDERFTMLDMSLLMGARSSPLVVAVAREMIRIQEVTAPDGAPVVPYIYFIVRPDGIRPFYEARARLESLGIAFGYELVDQDWEIAFPDLETWDAGDVSKPRSTPKPSTAAPGSFAWPADQPDQPGSAGTTEGNPFLWPRSPRASGRGSGVLADDFDRRRSGAIAGGRSTTPDTPGRTESSPEPLVLLGEDPSPTGSPGPRPGFGSGSGAGDLGAGERPTPNRSGRPGARDPAPGGLSLSPVSPEGLPGFDPVGVRRNGPAEANAGTGRSPERGGMPGALPPGVLPSLPRGARTGSLPAGVGPGDLSRLSALPPELVGRLASSGVPLDALKRLVREGNGASNASEAADGRVRLDLARLAEAGEEEDQDRPPVPPTALHPRLIEPGRGAGVAGGARPGSGGSDGPPGSHPGGGSAGSGLPSAAGSPGARPSSSQPGPTAPLRIEAPLDLTVACEPEGIVLHPGGYRLSLATLKKERGLETDLRTIVRNHALIDPSVRPLPRLSYVVEPGGEESFLEARKQMVLSGLGWPVTIRSSASPSPRVFPKERF